MIDRIRLGTPRAARIPPQVKPRASRANETTTRGRVDAPEAYPGLKGTFSSKIVKDASKKVSKKSPCKLAKTKTKARELIAAVKSTDEEQAGWAVGCPLVRIHF